MSELTSRRVTVFSWMSETGFLRGLAAVLAFLPIVIFAATLALSARAAGFTSLEVLALSGLIYAGSAQVSIVALAGTGANPFAMIATAMALNLRHVMYGLSLGRWTGPLPPRWRVPIAFVLTDETYGVTIREYARGNGAPGVALGFGIGHYLTFVLSTALGIVIGGALPVPETIDFGFVFPLIFLALLIPLLRTRAHLMAAVAAGVLTLAMNVVLPGGVTVLLVILVTSLGWTVFTRPDERLADE